MNKYIATIRKPCNFNSASPAAKNWNETMEMRIVVTDAGAVWVRKERHDVGVINLKAAGGKWERHTLNPRQSVLQWLEQIDASPATFRGGPRGVK